MKPDLLEKICQRKRQEVAQAIAAEPIEQLMQRAARASPPRAFFAAVTSRGDSPRVIAEIKRASPSTGLIRPNFDPVAIARAYADNGAAAISCLTDWHGFKGKLAYIDQIKRAVELPVLRKDFIIDPYQVYEARAAGADGVLLIAECLDEARLLELMGLAAGLGMTTLVEVYQTDNLLSVQKHLVGRPATLLGINNRNLKTMQTNVNRTLELLDRVVDRSILVSESGIRTHQDIRRLMDAGVYRVLVGEHLMKQPDVGQALARLIGG